MATFSTHNSFPSLFMTNKSTGPHELVAPDKVNNHVEHPLLVEATREYIETMVHRTGPLACAVILTDNHGLILDVFGDESLIHHFHVNGLHPGKVISRDKNTNFGTFATWSIQASRISTDNGLCRLGTLFIAAPSGKEDFYQKLLVHSMSLCISAMYAKKIECKQNFSSPGEFLSLNQKDLLRLSDVEKLSTLTSLTAGIAHEIRNPLTTAKGFLQLFMKRVNTPTDQQYLTLTVAELDRIQLLLTDFMGIARPEPPKFSIFDMRELMRTLANFLSPEATLRSVILQLDTPTYPVCIRGDQSRLKQVLMNLVQNAVQACACDGVVQMQLFTDLLGVHVQIIDNGCGIEDISQLFRPFYTTKPQGTGLGLLVSKTIVEEHEGMIDITSNVGLGTTVTLHFPPVLD